MKNYVLVLAASLVLAACVSTNVKSYTDSDFSSSKVTKLIVDLRQLSPEMRDEMDTSIHTKLKDIGVVAVPISVVVPPTRDISPEQAKALVLQGGYDAILTMNLTEDKERTTYGGSISTGTARAYAYGNNATAYGSSVSTPLVNSRGNTAFSATLFDAKTGKKIWVADLNAKAQGTAFVGRADRIAASAADALVKKLREDGRI